MSQNKPNLFSIVVNEQSTKYKVWSINYACILHLLFHLVDDNQSLGVDLCSWHVRLCWLQETPAMFVCGKGIGLFTFVITRIQETPAIWGLESCTWGGFWWFKKGWKNKYDAKMIFHLGMPVVLFMSLLANGQSETQWFPRHLKGADIRTVLMIQMSTIVVLVML